MQLRNTGSEKLISRPDGTRVSIDLFAWRTRKWAFERSGHRGRSAKYASGWGVGEPRQKRRDEMSEVGGMRAAMPTCPLNAGSAGQSTGAAATPKVS